MSATNEKSIPYTEEPATSTPAAQPAQGATGTRATYAAPQMHIDSIPAQVHCPKCNKDGLSKVEREMSTSTLVAAIAVCCICWPAGCYMCLSDSMKENHHKCSSCGHDMGKIVTVTSVAPAAPEPDSKPSV
ncbi:hypothetical protein DL89DRAFT_265995 [Linderina pennispora]|uniref:LITAF domain-containing protein n=1 Tax=Linderina pennispora TaxID=61395 RepID=A0A1Y1WFY8_9FUNG|nr:uncharacterized protein DL89DRAFT_265995 [Linderina pennispora]ORX72443.1 hypothetical protein DL89DRAFT_265995 [Linderina pennispora]